MTGSVVAQIPLVRDLMGVLIGFAVLNVALIGVVTYLGWRLIQAREENERLRSGEPAVRQAPLPPETDHQPIPIIRKGAAGAGAGQGADGG